jgi:hypothetical protein
MKQTDLISPEVARCAMVNGVFQENANVQERASPTKTLRGV